MFGRSHVAAFLAEEAVLEFHRCNPEFIRCKLIKQLLRFICAVVITDAGMIAADDKMRATVVFADKRVENGFSRPRIPHSRQKYAEEHAVFRIIMIGGTW